MNAYRFKIPFVKPVVLKGQSYSIREGVLLEQDGQWSEASPLPGFSSESIDDVIAAVRGEQPAPPSLQFALQALETPIVDPVKVPWNGLLLGDREQVLAATEKIVQANCQAAKLKVGRNELQADIALVKEVRERLPAQVRLRLDANQAWTFEQAVTFFQGIDGVDLEYVEEPLQDGQLLEQLFSKTGAKYALDETLLGVMLTDASCFEPWPNAAALICKPTILGGRDAVQRLASGGKPVVFSAAFESGVGVVRVAQLAAEFSPELAAGLDTLDWLSDDLLINSPLKQKELLVIPSAPTVDPKCLEAIR